MGIFGGWDDLGIAIPFLEEKLLAFGDDDEFDYYDRFHSFANDWIQWYWPVVRGFWISFCEPVVFEQPSSCPEKYVPINSVKFKLNEKTQNWRNSQCIF